MNLIFILIILLPLISSQIYYNKVIAKKVTLKRKHKIFELLKDKFAGLKEINPGVFECDINNNKNILFQYIAGHPYRYRISNHLIVYLEISNIEEDIKKLCKIHFECSTIDNRDWVKKPVDLFLSNSLNSLVNYSEKTIKSMISETEFYISEKRAERDKNSKLID
jgi:hypothetical protein